MRCRRRNSSASPRTGWSSSACGWRFEPPAACDVLVCPAGRASAAAARRGRQDDGMPLVTLVMASGPGFPAGSPAHRYEMEVMLNGERQLDSAAWQTDPNPWPARRIWPDEPPREGDVQYDPEAGW